MRPAILLLLVVLSASTSLSVNSAEAQQPLPEETGPIKQAIQDAAGKAKSFGEDAYGHAKGLGGSLRRLALQVGTGVDTGSEVTDPFLPKGDDRRYAWDAHVVVRNDGTALQAKNTELADWHQLAFDWRLKFDPFHAVNLDHARDEVLDTFNQVPPARKYGWGLGLSGVRNDYWGGGLDIDKTKTRESPAWTTTRQTTLSLGYSPLGKNPDKPWNAALVSGVYWTDIHTSPVPGVVKAKAGPGFSVGPTFQLGLDEMTRPLMEKWNIEDKIKFDRYRASLVYNGSSVGYAAWKFTTDVRMYVTKNIRMTLGFEETYFMSGRTKFKVRTGLSIFLHFVKITL